MRLLCACQHAIKKPAPSRGRVRRSASLGRKRDNPDPRLTAHCPWSGSDQAAMRPDSLASRAYSESVLSASKNKSLSTGRPSGGKRSPSSSDWET